MRTLTALLLAAACAHQPLPAEAESPAPAIVHPDLVLDVTPAQPQFMLHEPAYANVTFTNTGKEPLTVWVQWHSRNELGRPESFVVTAKDAAGAPVDEVGELMSFGGIIGPTTLAPGGSHTGQIVFPHWLVIDEAGTYQVQTVATVLLGDELDGTLPKAVVEAQAQLRVVPDEPEAMRAALEAAAKAWPNDDNLAGKRILAWRDPGVVPHLIAATKHPHLRPVALHALGKWPTADAVEAIASFSRFGLDGAPLDIEVRKGLEDQAQRSVRHGAAAALAENTHESAWPALRAMRNDPAMEVRLTVLHQASGRNDEKALVDAFTQDPDRTIASEAKRYQGLR